YKLDTSPKNTLFQGRLLFVQWTTFDQGLFRRSFGRCKSFEDITYNDTHFGQPALHASHL
ncbi:MAG: hypothetical protein ACKVH8_12780, partial [Pirellulales bacterium]